jgi:hypothetical protein
MFLHQNLLGLVDLVIVDLIVRVLDLVQIRIDLIVRVVVIGLVLCLVGLSFFLFYDVSKHPV